MNRSPDKTQAIFIPYLFDLRTRIAIYPVAATLRTTSRAQYLKSMGRYGSRQRGHISSYLCPMTFIAYRMLILIGLLMCIMPLLLAVVIVVIYDYWTCFYVIPLQFKSFRFHDIRKSLLVWSRHFQSLIKKYFISSSFDLCTL